jgi:hypothetical protein
MMEHDERERPERNSDPKDIREEIGPEELCWLPQGDQQQQH